MQSAADWCEPYKIPLYLLLIQFFKHSAHQGIGFQIIVFPPDRGWRSLAADLDAADPQDRDEDLEMKMETMTDSDICALCGGKLREGLTELVLKAGN